MMVGQSSMRKALRARMATDKCDVSDEDLNTRLNAIGALMKDCPDVNHRIALLAWAPAVSMVSNTSDERNAMLVGFGACVNRQLTAMDHMMGQVAVARMQ